MSNTLKTDHFFGLLEKFVHRSLIAINSNFEKVLVSVLFFTLVTTGLIIT